MSDPRFARRPRNGCSACRQDFTSVALFDAHRVGRHEYDYDWSPEQEDGRRCLDVEEMLERGWQQDEAARWFDPVHVERARNAFSEVCRTRETRGQAKDDREAA